MIDFGIAKVLTGDRLTDRTLHTARGLAIGSYESMRPRAGRRLARHRHPQPMSTPSASCCTNC